MVEIPRQMCAGFFFGIIAYGNAPIFEAGDSDMTAEKSVEQRMLAAAQKVKREQDAIAALKEYQAEKARVDANTLRLRALRLAKDAADAKTLAEQPVTRKATARAKSPRAKTPS
jgi:hypothetical protein